MEPIDIEQAPGHKKKHSFKVIASMVLAAKRFMSALNPSYDYGKRPASPTINGVPTGHMAASGRAMSARAASARTASGAAMTKTYSGRPEAAGKQHGYKGNLLFKPLPPLAGEQETTA